MASLRKQTLFEEWQQELQRLVMLSGRRGLAGMSPRLLLKSGPFSPWFLPMLWLIRSPGAWSYWNLIAVSEELLDAPPEFRRYLLGHELGHIARGHNLWPMLGAFLTVCAYPAAATLPAFGPTWFAIGASFVLLVTGAGLVFASLSMIPEYQADEFCASLIGRRAVADGIHWMAQRSGRGMSRDRVKRLKRLGFPPAQ